MKRKEFDIGKKVKEINVDYNQKFFIHAVLLVIFNLLLLIATITLGCLINVWYIWLIDILMIISCFITSVCNFTHAKARYKYTICTNGIMLNSMWYDNMAVDYKLIKRIKMGSRFIDRIASRGTYTITIFLRDDLKSKLTLYFVKDDMMKIKQSIEEQAKNARIQFEINEKR